MAKISTYQNDSSPSLSDKLIGTDVDDMNMTKNYTISSILSVPGSSTYVPYTGATDDVNISGFGFYGAEFVVIGGTSAQFLKADGSVDNNTYLTTGDAASTYATIASLSSYVPYSGATGSLDMGVWNVTATDLYVLDEAFISLIQPQTDNLLIKDATGLNTIASFDFANLTYTIGDVSGTQNSTIVEVNDTDEQIKLIANDYIEIGGKVLANASIGASGQVLTSQGSGGPVQWTDIPSEWTEATVTMDELELTNMGSSPIQFIPDPAAGTYYEWEITIERLSGTIRLNSTDAFLVGSPTSYFGALVGPNVFFVSAAQYVQLSSRAAFGYVSNTEVITIGGNTGEGVYFTTYSTNNPISVLAGSQFKAKIKYKVITFG